MILAAALLPAAMALAAHPGSAVPPPDPVFTVQDPRIDEASGMVDLGHGLTVLTNDSGDSGRVFVVDARGRTVGITRFGDSVDAEALAPVGPAHGGPDEVWVGDIGDNRADRPYVVLRKVPVGRGDRVVSVPAYRLVYPDGPHDAETLLSDPRTGRLYLVTKALFGGDVYAVPRPLEENRDNRLRKVAAVSVFATDGAFLADGRRVLVRGYGSADLYSFPGFALIRSVSLPAEPQGESISVGPGDRVRVASEGLRQPVLPVRLPATAAPPPRADDTRGPVEHDGTVHERRRGIGGWDLIGGIALLGAMAVAGLGLARRRRAG